MLQTFQPDHPVMAALVEGDLRAFRDAEAALRAPGEWPPFGRLAALIVSAADADSADSAARALARTAPDEASIIVLGPAPAPFAILRGRHRRRLLVKAGRGTALQPVISAWLARAQVPSAGATRVDIDIDPISFL